MGKGAWKAAVHELAYNFADKPQKQQLYCTRNCIQYLIITCDGKESEK